MTYFEKVLIPPVNKSVRSDVAFGNDECFIMNKHNQEPIDMFKNKMFIKHILKY